MTAQQELIVAKNTALFNAYYAVTHAAELNEITFDQMVSHLETLHQIKTKETKNVEQITH